jgi:hypothetical protein
MTTKIISTPDCNDGYNYNPESSCPICGDGFQVPAWAPCGHLMLHLLCPDCFDVMWELQEEDVPPDPFLTERIILELLIRSGVELRG